MLEFEARQSERSEDLHPMQIPAGAIAAEFYAEAFFSATDVNYRTEATVGTVRVWPVTSVAG
ncbi:hypothetical protein C481_09028 [Natrialba asiatica DSM 12278]|uniref:Uncharacterized protein n=1 Tax=Natrialba asiatica (strain ATCC 700177 / DSM 12278 / JCM 9576 / FERM P-10747 / NBRC 102637 / 172P1) TaxID=29540 RepID=M0ATZ2_NATA1|nr:hypothetical protein C481_09028 [Natrialba asiatica DSM 12278]